MSPISKAATARTRDLSELIVTVFDHWRAEGVAFLVLRNYEGLPDNTGNDVDVLVRPGQLKQAEQVLVRAAREAGYHRHNRAEFSPVSLFFHQPETLQQIQIDLFYSLQWRGFDLLLPGTVVDWRADRGLLATPHPVHEAVNDLLTRQIFHGYVKEEYKPTICAGIRQFPAETETVFRRMFGKTVGRKLAAAIREERWADVEAQTRGMRRQLIWRRLVFQPVGTLLSLLKDGSRLLGRFWRPPGVTVVLLGADGSGKSSVATRLIRALQFTFNPGKGLHIHWKPAVFLRRRREERPATTDPHAQRPRNASASMFALLYHWLEFWAGAVFWFHRALFRNGMVLVERYHYDFIVDPRRYRLRGVGWLARMLFRFLPAPDLVFLLDAPPEVLHARKPEVALEETRRQREAYRALVAKLPQGRIIDCTEPLEAVVNRIASEVLSYLEARQSRRHSLE